MKKCEKCGLEVPEYDDLYCNQTLPNWPSDDNGTRLMICEQCYESYMDWLGDQI